MSGPAMTGQTGEFVPTHLRPFKEGVAEALWAARNLARNRGYHVFPCGADKKPHEGSRGFKDATRDPEQIERLWRLFPGPLVGVRTGEASGISVLDVDVKHSTARAWWHGHAGRLPRTRTYRSMGGGLHAWFTHTPGVGVSQGRDERLGLDVRGEGGYIIHWFSAGTECLDNTVPAPWPDWLWDAVRTPEPKPVTAPAKGAWRRRGGPDKGVPAILLKVATAPEGSRNGLLHWGAHRLAERVQAGRLDRAQAEADLLRAALHAGLPQREAANTIRSGMRGVAP